jgi:hypothetical protein
MASARPASVVQSKTGLMGVSLGSRFTCTETAHRPPRPLGSYGARATARADTNTRGEATMRGSGLIWTIVGVLLIIALLLWILGRV